MYELIQVGKNTFYMDCPTNVGFYKIQDNEVVIIDAGGDKDTGKKIKKILNEQGWVLKAIYNTHSHADHTGGNQYLQAQTGCKIFAPELENSTVEYPILEPTMLYGGFSMKELQNKFLMAKESTVEKLTEELLPKGMEIISLPGHSYNMVGFKTDDDVIFLADCISSSETLEKYQIGFLYDVKAYIETLTIVKNIKANYFVPAHANATQDITELVEININKTNEIINKIENILLTPMTFEELLAKIFDYYQLNMTLQQRFLVGSTIKSYLSYLKNENKIDFYFENNLMLWKGENKDE